jgi:hypothetical protein
MAGKGHRRIMRLSSHPLLDLSAKTATILSCLIALLTALGVVALLHHSGSAHDPGGQTGIASSRSSAAATAAISGSSNSGNDAAVGRCLDTSSRIVSCSSVHEAELFGTGSDCSEAVLLGYLGGQPSLDIVSPLIHRFTVQVGATQFCAVQPASDFPPSTSAHRILDDNALGSYWRRCRDDRVGGREVLCSQPHTSEFVYSGVLAASDSLNCAARATTYLAIDISTDLAQLSVVPAVQGSMSECLVEVRGENHLTGSLRRIGTESLPISPN